MSDYILKHRVYFLFATLLVLIYFPIFLHMDYMPFRMWDESILGSNAIEMAQNHNYIVTYFAGHPDMMNCKPPMMIWCIVGCSKILGFSELSVRFPSALAALILCVFLFFSLRTYTGSAVYGFIVVAILVTCQGYIGNHVTRTGEYDSLLVLFSTIFSLHLFFATETTEQSQQSKHLFLFFVFLTLAVLTKGIACMMQAPGLAIYVLIRKKIVPILKDKWFYAGLLFFLVFGVGYYFLRESMNPGYLQAVWDNELGGRFLKTNEGHTGNAWYYIDKITEWQFVSYVLLFPAAVLIGLKFSETKISRLVLFAFVTGACFLIIISLSATKLPWYDAPLFPYLAIITSSFFYFIYINVRAKANEARTYFTACLIAFLCSLALLSTPYRSIIAKVYFPKGDWWEEEFSVQCRILQQAAKGKIKIDDYKLVYPGKDKFNHGNVLRCYRQELGEHNIVAHIVDTNSVTSSDTAVVFDDFTKQILSNKFEITPVRHIDKLHADIIVCNEKN